MNDHFGFGGVTGRSPQVQTTFVFCFFILIDCVSNKSCFESKFFEFEL